MPIRTSANFYSRGAPKNQPFGQMVQGNYNVIAPMNKYINGYSFYNRVNVSNMRPWMR
jgi:hypothetical protein